MVKRSRVPPPRRIICVDLDETLALTLTALVRFHNATYGTSLTEADFHSYAYQEVWGGTAEEAYLKVREFYQSPQFLAIQPMQNGALETLKILKKRKFTLAVITSRQQFIADQTKRFIDRHFPGIFESIYFCNHYLTAAEKLLYLSKTKAEICREIGAEMLIDDSLDHARDCAAIGVDVLLFDLKSKYKWNHPPAGKTDQDFLPRNVRRVTDWNAVLAQFPRPSSPLRFSYTPTDEDSIEIETSTESDYMSSEGEGSVSDGSVSEGSVDDGIAVVGGMRPEYVPEYMHMGAVMA